MYNQIVIKDYLVTLSVEIRVWNHDIEFFGHIIINSTIEKKKYFKIYLTRLFF